MSLLIDALRKGQRGDNTRTSNQAMHEPTEGCSLKWLGIILSVVFVFSLLVAIIFYQHRRTVIMNHRVLSPVVAAPKAVTQTLSAQSPSKAMSIRPAGINNSEAGASFDALTSRYKQALAYIDQHDYQQAMVLLRNDQLIRVTQGQSAIALAKIYLMNNNNLRAEEVVRNALRYHTFAQNDLNGLLGQIYFNQQRYSEAIGVLKKNSPPMNGYMGYYALLARSYLKVNNPTPAANLFKQLIEKQPDHSSWWLGLALSYQEAGAYSQAAEAYHHASKLNTDDPQIKLFIEKELKLMGETQESQ
jgi:predicted Zn-dependent protease